MDVELNLVTRQALKGAKICKREAFAVALTPIVKWSEEWSVIIFFFANQKMESSNQKQQTLKPPAVFR